MAAIRVVVRTLSKDSWKIQLAESDTLNEIKTKINVASSNKILTTEIQKVIHHGKILQNTNTVQEMGIEDKDLLILLVQEKREPNAEKKAIDQKEKRENNEQPSHVQDKNKSTDENKLNDAENKQDETKNNITDTEKAIDIPKTLEITIRKHWQFTYHRQSFTDCKIKINIDQTVTEIKAAIIEHLKLPTTEIKELILSDTAYSHGSSVLSDEQTAKQCSIKDKASLFINVIFRDFPITVHVIAMSSHGFRHTLQLDTTVNNKINRIQSDITKKLKLHRNMDCVLFLQNKSSGLIELDMYKTCMEYKIQDNDIIHCKQVALLNSITMIDAVIDWMDGCMDVMKYNTKTSTLRSHIVRVLEPMARTLLCGVYDDDNIWSEFRGMRYIVKKIWQLVDCRKENYWKHWIATDNIYAKCLTPQSHLKLNPNVTSHFPKPTGININMMPFIMSKTFKESKLPLYLECYWRMIERCITFDSTQRNKIGYLTVQESMVQKGATHRRGGLHTETPGTINIFQGDGHNLKQKRRVGWGGGYSTYYIQRDGLYIASNIDDSCAIWNCKIVRNEENDREIIGRLGDIEHLRKNVNRLAKKTMMKAGLIYWICDRTPHESLPLREHVCRQFFRLVAHKVSIWYEQHNTKNPNGIVPDPQITQVIKGNKFGDKFCHHIS